MINAINRLRNRVAASQRMLADIHEAMAEMEAQGARDTPEYLEIAAACLDVSRTVTEAVRVLKQQEERAQANLAVPGKFNLEGIGPVKGTLGPVQHAGAIGHGPEVVNLQRFLNAVGFSAPTSGEFDKLTQQAVQRFQVQYKLKANGLVGAETRKLINSMLAGV